MLKRAKIAAAILGLASFSTPAWAQTSQAVSSSVAFRCNTIDTTNSPDIGRNCTLLDLTPDAINSCRGNVFSCGLGTTVQCSPAESGNRGQKDCSCSYFSN